MAAGGGIHTAGLWARGPGWTRWGLDGRRRHADVRAQCGSRHSGLPPPGALSTRVVRPTAPRLLRANFAVSLLRVEWSPGPRVGALLPTLPRLHCGGGWSSPPCPTRRVEWPTAAPGCGGGGVEGPEGRAGNGDCGVGGLALRFRDQRGTHAAPVCLTPEHECPLLVRLLSASALESFPSTEMKAEPIT